MKVNEIIGGTHVTQSEDVALSRLKRKLESYESPLEITLMSHIMYSLNEQFEFDDIDIVAIAPWGIEIFEVKHWNVSWVNKNPDIVDREAKRFQEKVQRVKHFLGESLSKSVRASFLLTKSPYTLSRLKRPKVKEIEFETINHWPLNEYLERGIKLTPKEMEEALEILMPQGEVIDKNLRQIAGYTLVKKEASQQDSKSHKIYQAIHSKTRDRVILHLYDFSATPSTKKLQEFEEEAGREYKALKDLQMYPWAPRIADPFQEVYAYPGELYYFTIVDPVAPIVAERAKDPTWHLGNRLKYSLSCVSALQELHEKRHFLHRNISPYTLRVKYDNTSLWMGFHLTKIPNTATVSKTKWRESSPWIAPEIQKNGPNTATPASDIYALCATLKTIFKGNEDIEALFDKGLVKNANARISLSELKEALERWSQSIQATSDYLPVHYWTEDQIIQLNERPYRIIEKVKSGEMGHVFKVIEMDPEGGNDLGTYMAKVVAYEDLEEEDLEDGEPYILKSYRKVREHLSSIEGFAQIKDIAEVWSREQPIVSIVEWINGRPLTEFQGIFEKLAEGFQLSPEALGLKWIKSVCRSLKVLHRHNLVHGDISPTNMVVEKNRLVLIDYDCVSTVGEKMPCLGTKLYLPWIDEDRIASASDDIYALASSFFHIIFGQKPFYHRGQLDPSKGLNWIGIETEAYKTLKAWMDRATHPLPEERFKSASDALKALEEGLEDFEPAPAVVFKKQHIDWLNLVLQSYPGSRLGNQETRGLDSDFASQTYVETALEKQLREDILNRNLRLVILCGNAGDGKTAMLQHLGEALGMHFYHSSKRIIEEKLENGLLVRMNLDGSAAWEGESADQLLNRFLRPFKDGKIQPQEDIVHLLAINDGRLYEWLDQSRDEDHEYHASGLIEILKAGLMGEGRPAENVMFINMNHRSLIGNLKDENIDVSFLNQLIDKLYGGERAGEIWKPCMTCSSKERCEVYRAAKLFGPKGIPHRAPKERRERARERLFEALQAVHLRGKVHITIRELRAALVFILFGVHACDDIHKSKRKVLGPSTLKIFKIYPYWDRAFDESVPYRQGEILEELIRFDPALETHPKIDRYLVSRREQNPELPPHYKNMALKNARRRAYFEWLEEDIRQIARDPDGFGLAGGKNLRRFRALGLAMDEESRRKLVKALCGGISRLSDLPAIAYENQDQVPLRIAQRTYTETAFWSVKDLNSFDIQPDRPGEILENMDWMHREVLLSYQYKEKDDDGQVQTEHLRLNLDLFNLLLELNDGYQLSNLLADNDSFVHLSVFVQRINQEDETELYAWSPSKDDTIYYIYTSLSRDTEGHPHRQLILKEL